MLACWRPRLRRLVSPLEAAAPVDSAALFMRPFGSSSTVAVTPPSPATVTYIWPGATHTSSLSRKRRGKCIGERQPNKQSHKTGRAAATPARLCRRCANGVVAVDAGRRAAGQAPAVTQNRTAKRRRGGDLPTQCKTKTFLFQHTTTYALCEDSDNLNNTAVFLTARGVNCTQ